MKTIEKDEITMPYPFNERGKVETIKEYKIYDKFEKLVNGIELTREEKNDLFHQIQSNSGKGNYMLMGCIIPFAQFMKTYLVKYDYGNGWDEIKAFDKTCIRSSFYTKNGIVKIVELPEE